MEHSIETSSWVGRMLFYQANSISALHVVATACKTRRCADFSHRSHKP